MTNHPKLRQKVLILGNSSVGKSALIQQYVNKIFPRKRLTLGIDFIIKKIVINSHVITMKICDTAGQERFRSLCRAHYRGADCCVLVFNVTDRKSFNDLGSWRDEFLKQVNPKNPRDYSFVVLGNKVDLDNRNVSEEEAEQWCKIHNIPYFETSAKDGRNLKEAFETIAQNTFETKAEDSNGSFQLNDPPKGRREPKSICCSNNAINFKFEKF